MRSARWRIAGHVAIFVATVVLTALSIWLGWGPVVLSP